MFLDANVLFTAAHNPKGKACYIIEAAESNKWAMVTCALAVEEAERNLTVKFPHCVRELKKLLRHILVVPTQLVGECPIMLPKKDLPFFLSALSAKCSHLLTGDIKDFGRHMNKPNKSAGILIQTVAEFLDSRF